MPGNIPELKKTSNNHNTLYKIILPQVKEIARHSCLQFIIPGLYSCEPDVEN
jgi:hypothetical protein